MKQVFLYIISLFVRFIPIKQNVILFESYPELGGSPWMIYQELIKRGYDKKYKLIWGVGSSFLPPPNIRTVSFFGKGLKHYIDKFLYIISAKVIIDSNIYIPKIHPKTFRLYTQHGAPLKNWKFYSKKIGKVDAILSLSEATKAIDAVLFPHAAGRFFILGYPSNDQLFLNIDLYKNGFLPQITKTSQKFDKIIGWLPTYRQHRFTNAGSDYIFPFGIPLLKVKEDFESINSLLKEHNILLAIQMHHAQKKNFPEHEYSNIILIHDSDKQIFNVSTMNLMHCFDALITDYSAAYHEYILLDRPIALSIDDYEEYSQKPGFCIDYFEWIKGVYLKNVPDLKHFIEDVANGIDSAKDERQKTMHRIHKYVDNKSTQRVVDFLIEKAKL